MRFRLSLFLVAALSAPASQAERIGGPIVDLDYQYYTVYGNSTLEIQKSISAQSPLKTRAESFAGKTDWTVRSEYHLVALASGGCRVEAPKVYVTIKIHIPRLRVSTSQSKAVQQEWSRYFAALQSHELQHAQTGVKAGGELLRRLNGAESQLDCQQAGPAIDKATKALIERLGMADAKLDRETQHGNLTGAVLDLTVR